MKLGLMWGYWGAGPPPDMVGVTQEAERLGYDSVWTAEAWGSDAFTPLGLLAGHTSTIKLGTSVVQLAARTPTATAMAAITLDHLSGGRFQLGLGVSGPQVVEGWYGRPSTRSSGARGHIKSPSRPMGGRCGSIAGDFALSSIDGNLNLVNVLGSGVATTPERP